MKTFHPPPSQATSSESLESVAESATSIRRFHSGEIFANAVEIEIEHNGSIYRLRKTSLGKLILTK